jgi:hypothetical protein
MIGNSVIQGSGSKDPYFLNKYIAKNSEAKVINSGISGGSLNESVNFAIYTISKKLEEIKKGKVQIFILYPLTRFYVMNNFTNTKYIFSQACSNNSKLKNHLINCNLAKENSQWSPFLSSIQYKIFNSIPCSFSSTILNSWIDARKVSCDTVIDLNEESYLEPINIITESEKKKSKEELQELLKALDTEIKIETKSLLAQKTGRLVFFIEKLEEFLRSQKLDFQIEFLFPRENLTLLERLPSEKKKLYYEKRMYVIDKFKSLKPEINLASSFNFTPGDHFDVAHLNRHGQKKLANYIIKKVKR